MLGGLCKFKLTIFSPKLLIPSPGHLDLMEKSLDHWQRAAAKRVATDVIGSPAPRWMDLGDDLRDERYRLFLKNLRESNNRNRGQTRAEQGSSIFPSLREGEIDAVGGEAQGRQEVNVIHGSYGRHCFG